MFQLKKINNIELTDNFFFLDYYKKKCYGLKKFNFFFFLKRFELFNKKSTTLFLFYPKFKLVLYKYLKKSFALNKVLKNNNILSILFLNFINTYKGWRHFKGLPVRGQRTWSNAWTCYKNNQILRREKLKLIKNFYGKISSLEQKIAFLCEYINFLWKTQWFHEWMYSRRYIKKSIKISKKIFRIDLLATAKGFIGNIRKNNPKVGKKKKKMLTGSIGFDQGFTKLYLKIKYESKNKKKIYKSR